MHLLSDDLPAADVFAHWEAPANSGRSERLGLFARILSHQTFERFARLPL